jgi:hypothetical protein
MFKRTTLAYSVAAFAALALLPSMAQAETAVTKTYIQTKENPDVNNIDFTAFDVNNDGSYSMAEVGEKLFYIFDTDGNEVIDNIEWDNRNFYTITPMEVESFKFVDYDGDGRTDASSFTYDTFYKESGLMKFDEDQDGLSAGEFIDEGYEVLDTDEDKMITLKEWQRAYLESRPKHNQSDSYQN